MNKSLNIKRSKRNAMRSVKMRRLKGSPTLLIQLKTALRKRKLPRRYINKLRRQWPKLAS